MNIKGLPGVWRMKTVMKKLLSIPNLQSHRSVLENVLTYYFSLVVNIPSNIYNVEFLFNLKDGTRLIIPSWIHTYIFDEIYIDKCYDIDIIENPSTIIDIGANIGIFTVRVARRWTNAQIYCYEPEPDNFNLLKKNVALNSIKNVIPFQCGVTKEDSPHVLYLDKKNRGMHSIYTTTNPPNYVNIDCVCLKTIFNENCISVCDILKLDCEGAEYEILESIDQDLSTRIKCIVAELTPKRPQDIKEPLRIRKKLKSLNYKVHTSGNITLAVQSDM